MLRADVAAKRLARVPGSIPGAACRLDRRACCPAEPLMLGSGETSDRGSFPKEVRPMDDNQNNHEIRSTDASPPRSPMLTQELGDE